MEWESQIFGIGAFLAAGGVALLLLHLIWARDPRVEARLTRLSESASSPPGQEGAAKPRSARSRTAASTLPQVVGNLLANDRDLGSRLRLRLQHAGIYAPYAPAVFQITRVVLAVVPIVVAVALGYLRIHPMLKALAIGCAAAAIGFAWPGVWLDRRKARRQAVLNRALPDVLDLTVTCVEAGLSMEASLKRVTEELRLAHPLLAAEMAAVQKQIEFGAPPEEAIANLAERTDLESLATLSVLVQQARRFGTGIAEALRTHAEMLRVQREEMAEERAQKASVKILFPTLLFIFPATFVVLAGPAAIQLKEMFHQKETAKAVRKK